MRRLLSSIRQWPENTRSIVRTCVYGLGAGCAAVAFLKLMNLLYASTYVALSHQSVSRFLAGTFAVITLSSLIVGYLLNRFSRESAGSGIPQLKKAFWKDLGFVPWRTVSVKFVAGIVSIGGGASLGREGPSVQVGGGVASNIAGLLGEPKQNRRLAAAAGAAAGLAAAFNTPLAATTFVLEEIVGDMNSRLLGSVILSAVVGAFVTFGLIGKQPAFLLPSVESPSWPMYIVAPFVAAFASLVGMAFQIGTVRLRARVKKTTKIPGWLQPTIGGWTTWLIGCAVFLTTGKLGVFALGYGDLSDALHDMLGWKLAGILILTKLVATIVCYGFAGCGGIFSPTLFLGGMCGIFLAGVAGHWIPLTHADHVILAVVGMSACFGAVVRAPLTALLIVFEMTHQFSVVPALMIGTLVSQAISRRVVRNNFYDAILQQDGHELVKLKPPRDLKSWQNLPVSVIANFKPVVVNDLSEAALNGLLAKHPYSRFPVVLDSQLKGIVTRRAIEVALGQRTAPAILPGIVCAPTQPVHTAANMMIESPVGMLLLTDPSTGSIAGLITLHDLLRAQVSMSE